jgi:hypothetical protein
LRGAVALLVVALGGCDGSGGTDAGPPPDGVSAPGGATSCAAPRRLTGPDDGTPVRALFDTSALPEGAIELYDCGPTAESPPQVVVEYLVPGTGPHAITVSTANTGTDGRYDTVLALRRDACDGAASDFRQRCFDDEGTERRARGSMLADGGETIWIIVTGYPGTEFVDRGLLELTIAARPDRPPIVESATVLVTPMNVQVEVVGTDDDADAQGVYVTFHGPSQELIDADGDGDADGFDYLNSVLDRSVQGATRFRETATIPLPAGMVGSATEAWVTLFDAAGLESPVDVSAPVVNGDIVGRGAACDAMNVCARELECRTATCQATADRAIACGAATPIMVPTPTTTATSGSAATVLLPGEGLFSGECSSTVGRESIYTVAVPMGAFDLIASTDTAGTATTVDTVVYARTVCEDPATSPMDGCHDDIDFPANPRSRLELLDVTSPSVTLFVEHYAGVPPGVMARIELEVTLRPVLAMGAACDPTEVMNRCAGGRCPTDTRVCP